MSLLKLFAAAACVFVWVQPVWAVSDSIVTQTLIGWSPDGKTAYVYHRFNHDHDKMLAIRVRDGRKRVITQYNDFRVRSRAEVVKLLRSVKIRVVSGGKRPKGVTASVKKKSGKLVYTLRRGRKTKVLARRKTATCPKGLTCRITWKLVKIKWAPKGRAVAFRVMTYFKTSGYGGFSRANEFRFFRVGP
jgi:hypothetical protein